MHRTEMVIYRDSDPLTLDSMVRNSKLPLRFLADDRETLLGHIVSLRISGDKLIGTVETQEPIQLRPEQEVT